MSKFVLIVNFEGGVVDTPMEEWKPEEVQAHLDYYRALNRELRASGELIETAVLAGPELAKVVTSNGKGSPMVTDGPFQEFKEWAAGYQIVDVESEARALEIAGRISAVPGPNGIPTEQPIQVRQLMESSPSNDDRDVRVAGDGGRHALTPAAATEDLLRELAPRVLGAVLRRYGDFDAAEDAVQEALVAAATRWPSDGVPEQPMAWLVRTASRRMIDQWRSDESRRAREAAVAPSEAAPQYATEEDDTLLLLFLCCHPSLTPGSAIPLTLRAVGGLTTAEIARAFLVPEPTMAQRISRAKQRIRDSGIGFAMPTDDELAIACAPCCGSCT